MEEELNIKNTEESKKKEIGTKGIIIMVFILIIISILIGYLIGYLYLRADYIEYLKRCFCIWKSSKVRY